MAVTPGLGARRVSEGARHTPRPLAYASGSQGSPRKRAVAGAPRLRVGLPGTCAARIILPGRCPMANDAPIALFLTWTTYGTWLPGDARGWVEYRRGFQLPDSILELECAARMSEDACRLAPHQRERVHE